MDKATKDALEAALQERVEANGGDVDAVEVIPRRPGQVFANVKLSDEDEPRQAVFSVADLLGE